MNRLVGEEKKIFDKTVEFVEKNITLAPLTSTQRDKLRKIRAGKIGELEGLVEYNSQTLWLAAQYCWHDRLSYAYDTMTFNGTNHRFNLFCKVLKENLPLVWKKEQLQKERQVRTDAKIEVADLPNFENPYITNNIRTDSEILKELW